MPEFKTKEEYEKWKAERVQSLKEKHSSDKADDPVPPVKETVSINQEKKCPHCAMMIPKEARICPYCRKELKMRAITQLAILISLFLLIFVFIGSFMSPNKNKVTPYVPSYFDACYMSQQFIRKALKAPSTADFAPCSESKVEEIEINHYKVCSYVDAQNSFGAKIRNHYECELKYVGNEKWTLLDYKIRD